MSERFTVHTIFGTHWYLIDNQEDIIVFDSRGTEFVTTFPEVAHKTAERLNREHQESIHV